MGEAEEAETFRDLRADLRTLVRRVVDYSSEVTVFWRREDYQSMAPQKATARVCMYLGRESLWKILLRISKPLSGGYRTVFSV